MWKTLVTVLDPIRIFCDHLLLAPGELRPDVGPEFGPDGLGGRAGKASSYLQFEKIYQFYNKLCVKSIIK
jgi:hypothetical protein